MKKIKKSKKFKIKFWVSLLVIFLVLLGGYFYFSKNFSTQNKIHNFPAPVVSVTKVSIQTQPIFLIALGTLIAPNDVTLMAEQSGQIKSINFKSGDLVKAGDLLFKIDDVSQKAQVAQAQANYQNAQAEYQRYLNLNKTPGMVSKENLDQNKANYLADLGALDQAQKNLNETEVKAPFDGIVAAPQAVRGEIDSNGNSLSNITQIAPGAYVTAGTALVEIVDQKDLLAQYTLPQEDFSLVKNGQKITLSVNAFKNQLFNGLVNYISPSLNTLTRTFTVRAKIENTDGKLSPGMMVKVTQLINPDHQALVIPAMSLMVDLEGFHVYGIKDSKVISIPVKAGERYGNNIEILSGLKPGDLVVSAGMQKVHEGQVVKISPF